MHKHLSNIKLKTEVKKAHLHIQMYKTHVHICTYTDKRMHQNNVDQNHKVIYISYQSANSVHTYIYIYIIKYDST